MRPSARHTSLTDAEIERLDEFLRKDQKAMNLEEVDGFFTALICGPDVVMPSEYQPHVFGKEDSIDGVFQTVEEAREILGLLNRHWNTIAQTLLEGQEYLPLLQEDDAGVANGNDWANGFLRGMKLRRGSWKELLEDDQHGGSLVTIFLLAHEHDPDPNLRPSPISPEKRPDILASLAANTTLIYKYFRGRGRAVAKR